PARVLREKLLVRIRCIGSTRALPIFVFSQLRETHARLRSERAIRMTFEKMVVGFRRVRGLRGFPIDALAATTCDERHAHDHQHSRSQRAQFHLVSPRPRTNVAHVTSAISPSRNILSGGPYSGR